MNKEQDAGLGFVWAIELRKSNAGDQREPSTGAERR